MSCKCDIVIQFQPVPEPQSVPVSDSPPPAVPVSGSDPTGPPLSKNQRKKVKQKLKRAAGSV